MNSPVEKINSHTNQILNQDWRGYLYLVRTKRLRKNLLSTKVEVAPPRISSVEDLFIQAGNTANSIWLNTAFDILSTDIDKVTTTKKDKSKLPLILKDKNKLRKALEKNKYFKLEALHDLFPDVWKEVLLFASEKEQLKLELAEKWVKDLPDEDIKMLGMAKQEFEFIFELQRSIQPLVDSAFIKQIGVAGQSSPIEIQKIIENLRVYSKKMKESKFFQGHLKYQGFPKYLNQIAEAYASGETDPVKLHEIWGKVDRAGVQLAKSGCPIIINCHNNNPAYQDELEFSVQIRANEALELEKLAIPYYKKAKKLSPNKAIPPVIVGFNISNSGVNLYYQVLGVARTNITSIHSEQLERGIDGKVVLSNFLTTLAHELGHQIRVDNISNSFDEIKADLLGIFIDYLLKKEPRKNIQTVPIEQYIRELVYGYSEEMLTSSGDEGLSSDHYSLLGQFFISFFAGKKIINIKGGMINIDTNKQNSFPELIQIGADILGMCEDPIFDETKAKEFFENRIRPIINYEALKPYLKIFEGEI